MSAPYPGVYSDNSMPYVTRSPIQTMRTQPYGSFIQFPSREHQVIVNLNGRPGAPINTGVSQPMLQGLSPYLGPVTYTMSGLPVNPYNPSVWGQPLPALGINNRPDVRVTVNGVPQNYGFDSYGTYGPYEGAIGGFPELPNSPASGRPAYPTNSSLPGPLLLGYMGYGPLY